MSAYNVSSIVVGRSVLARAPGVSQSGRAMRLALFLSPPSGRLRCIRPPRDLGGFSALQRVRLRAEPRP